MTLREYLESYDEPLNETIKELDVTLNSYELNKNKKIKEFNKIEKEIINLRNKIDNAFKKYPVYIGKTDQPEEIKKQVKEWDDEKHKLYLKLETIGKSIFGESWSLKEYTGWMKTDSQLDDELKEKPKKYKNQEPPVWLKKFTFKKHPKHLEVGAATPEKLKELRKKTNSDLQ